MANADHAHKGEEIKGRVKEAAGTLTDNERLEREGKVDQAAAKVKRAAEKAKNAVEDLVEDAKDRIHHHEQH